MKRVRLVWFIFLAVLCIPVSLWAGAGLSGGQVLQQETAARPAGMAGAYAANGGDSYALAVNPAGLSDLKANEIMFLHAAGFEGLMAELLTIALPLPGLGVLAAQTLYRGQPGIDNSVPNESPVDVKDIFFGISFARPLAEKLNFGINVKLLMLTLGPADTSALAFDLGVQYLVDEKCRLGLAARNLGSGVKFHAAEDPLPSCLILGGQYNTWEEGPHSLVNLVDVDYELNDKNLNLRLGAEYWFRRMLALRLGYRHSQNYSVKSLTFGVGFRFKAGQVDLSLDYAYLPEFWEQTDFESENILSLGVRF